MIELNKDKIQVRFITGINKTLEGYPSDLDVLYDSCVECIDDCLFSTTKMMSRYSISQEQADAIIESLKERGFIAKSGSKYKIIGSIWH